MIKLATIMPATPFWQNIPSRYLLAVMGLAAMIGYAINPTDDIKEILIFILGGFCTYITQEITIDESKI